METLINEAWQESKDRGEPLDIERFAKYTRCLFQIALSDDPVLAINLLDKICGQVEEAVEVTHHIHVSRRMLTRLYRFEVSIQAKRLNGWSQEHTILPLTTIALRILRLVKYGLRKLSGLLTTCQTMAS